MNRPVSGFVVEVVLEYVDPCRAKYLSLKPLFFPRVRATCHMGNLVGQMLRYLIKPVVPVMVQKSLLDPLAGLKEKGYKSSNGFSHECDDLPVSTATFVESPAKHLSLTQVVRCATPLFLEVQPALLRDCRIPRVDVKYHILQLSVQRMVNRRAPGLGHSVDKDDGVWRCIFNTHPVQAKADAIYEEIVFQCH